VILFAVESGKKWHAAVVFAEPANLGGNIPRYIVDAQVSAGYVIGNERPVYLDGRKGKGHIAKKPFYRCKISRAGNGNIGPVAKQLLQLLTGIIRKPAAAAQERSVKVCNVYFFQLKIRKSKSLQMPGRSIHQTRPLKASDTIPHLRILSNQ
jgi:hypothetical protein